MFAELRLSFANDRFFDRLFSELPWIRENFVLLPSLAECFIHTTNLETGRLVVLFSGSPIARRSQCCMHADTSKFSSGSSTSRLWFNVCRQVGSPEWAGRRTLKYVSSQQETDCLLHMLGVGNVLSTSNLLVFSFEKLCGDRKQHEFNGNICSMENTKIKARRACKLLLTKKQAKEKRSWSVRRSPIHSLCVSHGYEPTPRSIV